MKTYSAYSVFVLLGIFLLLFGSCSKHLSKLQKNDIVIYPPPPDTTRIQFLTRITTSLDMGKRHSSFYEFIFGKTKPLPIGKPYGVSIHDGKIYVCDAGIGGFEIIDLKKNSFNYFIPKGFGQLKIPINCSVDQHGSLYVSDVGRHQIVYFDSTLNYAGSFGEGDSSKPTDVFVTDKKIWVVDAKAHKVNVYQKGTPTLLYSFPEIETGKDGYLFTPTNIWVTDDKVYVTDFGDFKIKVYTLEGDYLSSVGNYGSGLGQLVRPKGVAVDHESNVYVIDAGFENAQIFNKDGKLLMFFGGPYKGPGDFWLPAKVIVDYDNVKYFKKYVDPSLNAKYLIIVTNQYGPDKVNIYAAVEPAKAKEESQDTPKKK